MDRQLQLPIIGDELAELKAGDSILLTGVIYVARDAAHKRMAEALGQGRPLPFDIRGQAVYYMGPTPARPGRPIGAAGPTTSGRMDTYSPLLMEHGMKVMIGKGKRSVLVKEAMMKHGAVYLAAIGGAGALISRSIKKADVIAYEELGPEAIRRLEIEGFPAVVANDMYGGDIYQKGKTMYGIVRE